MPVFNLSELWDKTDEKSVQLDNLANLIFGENFHQIVLGNYLFAETEEFEERNKAVIKKIRDVEPNKIIGKLLSGEGEQFNEDFSLIYPIVNLNDVHDNTIDIRGYVLITVNDYYKLVTSIFSKGNNKEKDEFTLDANSFLDIIQNTGRLKVSIIDKNGDMAYGWIKNPSKKTGKSSVEMELQFGNCIYTSQIELNKNIEIADIFISCRNESGIDE